MRALFPPAAAGTPYAALAVSWQFLRYLAERYAADQCTRAAAALAYTSLLALVPLFTVVFITMAAFPAFQDWRAGVEDFIFRNFVPALGAQVREHLTAFSDKARGLQAAGISVLVVTVLAMLATIESTFNVIWGVRRRRPWMVRMLVYWAVLTLGPVLIGAGMVATSYVVSLPLLDATAIGGLRARIIGTFPLLATTLAFVLFFKLIPYRPVPLRHALAGGVVASVLFELAKRGFAVYVTQFPAQQAIYGAFATVPIFLLWIYLSWLIVLLGAEITQCLTTFRAVTGRLPSHDILHAAFRILYRLYTAQQSGHGLAEKTLLRQESAFDYALINTALERLDAAGWIGRNDHYEWIMLRDPGRVNLSELLTLLPSLTTLEQLAAPDTDDADRALAVRLAAWQESGAVQLDVPLASLFASTAAQEHP